jgi:hypothetical protein
MSLYLSQEPVAHACNPSCAGGRDQEDYGSKQIQPGQTIGDILSQKKKITKKGLMDWFEG